MHNYTREEFIKTWVEALRSGRYEKTEERFRGTTPDGGDCFCTLGVAFDLLTKNDKGGYNCPIGSDRLQALVSELDQDRSSLWNEITARNDGSEKHRVHTFDEMAHFLEVRLCRQ